MQIIPTFMKVVFTNFTKLYYILLPEKMILFFGYIRVLTIYELFCILPLEGCTTRKHWP
jgi:hypothetical protein